MIYFAVIVFLVYGVLILYLNKGMNNLALISDHLDQPEHSFSVLVPFRNEQQHLPALLESFSKLNYPADKFELLLINDDSADESEKLINQFTDNYPQLNISLINNVEKSASPKKAAISKGISMANFNWIITTDADCAVPESWLSAFNGFIRKESPKMIAGPVSYAPKKGFLHKFQLLDFLSLQGVTMGVFGLRDKKFGHPFLCNGANLCYQKESFEEVSGFEGNTQIPSGDDVFLLEKMTQRFPDDVKFIKSKESIVLTASKDSFIGLIHQRIRWASKTTHLASFFAKFLGLSVFITSLTIVILFILGSMGEIPWLHIGFLFLLKFNIDFVLLYRTSEFFGEQDVMKSYFISSLLHPFYTVLIVILSLKKNYTWKDRNYKKY